MRRARVGNKPPPRSFDRGWTESYRAWCRERESNPHEVALIGIETKRGLLNSDPPKRSGLTTSAPGLSWAFNVPKTAGHHPDGDAEATLPSRRWSCRPPSR